MVYLSRMVRRIRACRRFTLFLAIAATGAVTLAVHAWAGPRTTLVELYTSQGCSSCPPADEFLGELVKQPDVIPLSFHVDYWDYIGWKDPFAKPQFTRRQRDYSGQFKRGYVYTPQVIVQGAYDATGSDRSVVENAIVEAKHFENVDVSIERIKDGGMVIAIGERKGSSAGVWLAFFDGVHVTRVKRGENRGRTVKSYNVVRSLDRIGEWQGDAMSIPVGKSQMNREAKGRDGCVVFLQSDSKGPVMGVAALNFAPSN